MAGGKAELGTPAPYHPRRQAADPRAVAHPRAIAALRSALLAYGHSSPLAPVLGPALR